MKDSVDILNVLVHVCIWRPTSHANTYTYVPVSTTMNTFKKNTFSGELRNLIRFSYLKNTLLRYESAQIN